MVGAEEAAAFLKTGRRQGRIGVKQMKMEEETAAKKRIIIEEKERLTIFRVRESEQPVCQASCLNTLLLRIK